MMRRAELPPRITELCELLNFDWRALFPSETPANICEALFDAALTGDVEAFRAAAGETVVRDGYRRVRLVEWRGFDRLRMLAARAQRERAAIDQQIRALQTQRARLLDLVAAP